MNKTITPKFSEEVKNKCLLWCDRHCCLCKKNCGLDIEAAHINRKLNGESINDIDNAIPLCYDCHAKIGHYNESEPRGNKYKEEELKIRREQVYEEFTRHLVPLLDFQITQTLIGGGQRKFPDVGFQIRHVENKLPVRVFTNIIFAKNGKKITNQPGGHWSGEQPWKMNPGFLVQGHFEVKEVLKDDDRLSAKVSIEVEDEYGRRHKLLPMEWIYEVENNQNWWYNP